MEQSISKSADLSGQIQSTQIKEEHINKNMQYCQLTVEKENNSNINNVQNIESNQPVTNSNILLKELYNSIVDRMTNLEKRISNMEKGNSDNLLFRKKKRRKAKQISRNFVCMYSNCAKVYGSKTSLKNHMKLKHSYRMRRYNTHPILEHQQEQS